MKRLLVLFLVLLASCGNAPHDALFLVLLASCGNAPPVSENNEIGQTSQEATTHYSATNGMTSLPSSATKFCRLVYASSKNGHELSDTWSEWIPHYPFWPYKFGSLISAHGSSLIAKVYGGAAPPGRRASASVICNDFSDFGFGPNASQSTQADNMFLLWNTSVGEQYVGVDYPLWSPSAFCFLSGWDSISSWEEYGHVYRVSFDSWHIAGNGWPKLGVFAKCISPDRSYDLLGPYEQSGPGVLVGPAADGKTICAFTGVQGNMDDTLAYIYQEGGYWKLLVENLDPNDSEWWKRWAEMTCARFP